MRAFEVVFEWEEVKVHRTTITINADSAAAASGRVEFICQNDLFFKRDTLSRTRKVTQINTTEVPNGSNTPEAVEHPCPQLGASA